MRPPRTGTPAGAHAQIQKAVIRPASAFYNPQTSGFILPYEDIRQADEPEQVLLEFMQSTYEAGAHLAKWDRSALERTTAG